MTDKQGTYVLLSFTPDCDNVVTGVYGPGTLEELKHYAETVLISSPGERAKIDWQHNISGAYAFASWYSIEIQVVTLLNKERTQ